MRMQEIVALVSFFGGISGIIQLMMMLYEKYVKNKQKQ